MAASSARSLPPPAPAAGLPAKVVPVPPNQTLYVRNLPSAKIRKHDLRTALYLLFSTYGPVLDVVALKTMKMRGQAHIVFRDVQAATQAMRSLEGFSFFGHDLKITYAKSKSNVIARLDGTFKLPTAAQNVEVTDLQQSIFNAPVPGSAAATTGGAAGTVAPGSIQPQTTAANGAASPTGKDAAAAAASARGQKRTRDEEEEEEDEDEDSDVAMEEESDED
ncbi:RNA-binding domain containing protein [Niveomyces insectorum RCEF 264]|uniref:RNA-binding domain containing protein n=1 Tax=Niveomyces insectorum RCEF 264 TaxID=1081102 RepID=A0A167RWL7_9HYPO|nr:RNA-binding domain containing protein [Niveomyces insectorum RCEF 264]